MQVKLSISESELLKAKEHITTLRDRLSALQDKQSEKQSLIDNIDHVKTLANSQVLENHQHSIKNVDESIGIKELQ